MIRAHLAGTTEFFPFRVTWLTFDYEDCMDRIEAAEKCVLITKYLPESQPQLMFFVGFSQALHLGDKARFSLCPPKVEERIVWARSERLHTLGVQEIGQSVQGLGMSAVASIYHIGVHDERILWS
jgi:hypothetical protein